jgi:hypothetical protein
MLDIKSLYESHSSYIGSTVISSKKLIFQGSQRIAETDSLFYTPVLVKNGPTFKALLDSGSMACTISESAVESLLQQYPDMKRDTADDYVIVGCGGHRVSPKDMYDLDVTVYGCRMIVPVMVVPGQTEQMILGSNAIKHILTQLKNTDGYWRLVSSPDNGQTDDHCQFLSLLSNTERWRGECIPDKVGTVKVKSCVTLKPQSEHLVWGKLPESAVMSVGSTVVVEPTQSKARPKQILVGRVITPLWGDRWVPVKVINPTDRTVVLRRNAKIADVSPCIAVEDLPKAEEVKCNMQCVQSEDVHLRSEEDMVHAMEALGLQDVDLKSCEVSLQWKDKLVHIIEQYESIFSRHKMDCGEAKEFVHRIHLVDDKPFRLPYRRIPPSQYEKLRMTLNEMEEKGIIQKSSSEYASALVLVWKRNGDLRVCTDFRWLNARTVKDAYPLPHQADALAALGGNALFSTMDLTSGFYNVPLHPDDRKYTAFSSPFGLHEYNRLPQGLCNSPATFMRMMMSIFGDENFTSLLCYLDDLMVFAPTEEVALRRLEMVFARLKEHNLKLAPKKCFFLRRTVKFLGHVISEDGVQTNPEKVRAINDLQVTGLMESDGKTPCPSKIRSFLGMVMYYQSFIEACSAKAKPLFRLTVEPGAQRKHKRGREPVKKGGPVKLTPADWSDACQNAFETLKHDLMTSVTLAHPDFNAPFILAVDASFDGIGAVLSQLPPGGKVARPVAFASRTLSRSQLNYPAHRLEFLALKWAVCDKFSHWLKGRHFTTWTDNNPLTYILTKPKLDACEQRWVAKLAAYDFDLKYIPGPKNIVADALSREPFVQSCVGHRLVTEPYASLLDLVNGVTDRTVQEVFRVSNNCQAVVDDGGEASDEPVRGAVTPDTRGSVASEEVAAILNAQSTGGVSHVIGTDAAFSLLQKEDQSAALPQSQLVGQQEQDSTISRVMYFVQRHKRPTKRERAVESRSVIKLLKHWSRLTIQNGMLYKIRKDPQVNKKIFQFIVPDSLKRKVLQGLHDSAGHQGQHRTLSLVRQRFFWSGMERDVVNYVQSCQRCIVGKTPEPHSRAPLKNIVTSEPMELVCIDFWTAEQGNKSVDVLVVTDHFSKMAHAFLCKNQTAKQVARRLWNDFFLIYGFPRRIHSDQGANFESKLIRELLEMAGVQKSHTTPYHPMGNGVTERFNRTLGNMIRSLPLQSKAKWPQMLQQLTFCYNCTEHETTGFAPFYLVFGRIPRLPVDVMFQHALTSDTVVSHSDFVSRLRKDLHEAAQIVQRNSLKEQTRHAKLYNRKVKGSPLVVGDRVLCANRGVPGKRKVADKWESTPYEVISVRPELNVCRVKDCLTGRERVVHRNLLLCVSFLPCERGVDSGSEHSECDVAAHSSDACPDVPDVMEDSDVRTVSWLMQTSEEEVHSEEEDGSLDRRSDVAQSDSLSVAASSQDSQQIPAEDVDHAAVDGAEGPPQCSEGIVPDTDVTPPEAVCPDETPLDTDAADMSPPDNIPTDIAPPDSNPPDIDSPDTNAPEAAILDTDCPDNDIPGPLAQVVCTQPGRYDLRDRSSMKLPQRLICQMNEQVVDEDSVSTVSVSTLFQFFRDALSV